MNVFFEGSVGKIVDTSIVSGRSKFDAMDQNSFVEVKFNSGVHNGEQFSVQRKFLQAALARVVKQTLTDRSTVYNVELYSFSGSTTLIATIGADDEVCADDIANAINKGGSWISAG